MLSLSKFENGPNSAFPVLPRKRILLLQINPSGFCVLINGGGNGRGKFADWDMEQA